MTTSRRATSSRPRVRQRRIVERPRLISALERLDVRVRMLVAPAGYGKTTLAEQWLASGERFGAWCRLRPAAVDVAVLCRWMAAAAAQIVPDCDRWVLERLNTMGSPADDAELLAEMLTEALEEWPEKAWLVIDDYHELLEALPAQRFIRAFVERGAVNLLLTSRTRPNWVNGRALLYGEVLEIGASLLAMTGEEADQVVAGGRAGTGAGLVALANGWPAVIGLAGVLDTDAELAHTAPDELYAFFAEEVLSAVPAWAKKPLTLVSFVPRTDREIIRLAGSDDPEAVVTAGVSVGILERRGGALEFHPLARDAIRKLAVGNDPPEVALFARQALELFRERRDWDAAVELASAFDPSDLTAALLRDSLDDLMRATRYETVDKWSEHLSEASDLPELALARAEIAFRRGRLTEAALHANAAKARLNADDPIRFKAVTLSARIAHASSDYQTALDLFEVAASLVSNASEERTVLWGKQLCAIDLELPEGEQIVTDLSALEHNDPDEALLIASRRIAVQLQYGRRLDLQLAHEAVELLHLATDPMVRSAFLNTYGWALIGASEYDQATEQAQLLLDEIQRTRLEFADAHASLILTAASIGLGDERRSVLALGRALDASRRFSDPYVRVACAAYANKLRLVFGAGAVAAIPVEEAWRRRAAPSVVAQLNASRALALACDGRLTEGAGMATEALAGTREINARLLAEGCLVLVALLRRDSEAPEACRDWIAHSAGVNVFDPLLFCCRANDNLAALVATAAMTTDLPASVSRRIGHQSVELGQAGLSLSRREAEVHELLCRGLTAKQVGAALYISDKTVRVHIKSIYRKRGVNSRAALLLKDARKSSDVSDQFRALE